MDDNKKANGEKKDRTRTVRACVYPLPYPTLTFTDGAVTDTSALKYESVEAEKISACMQHARTVNNHHEGRHNHNQPPTKNYVVAIPSTGQSRLIHVP